jgi:hypothetical protein
MPRRRHCEDFFPPGGKESSLWDVDPAPAWADGVIVRPASGALRVARLACRHENGPAGVRTFRAPAALLVLGLALAAGCGTVPGKGTALDRPEVSGVQLLQRGTVDGRTWVLEVISVPGEEGVPSDCLTASWANDEGFVCQGSRLEDQMGDDQFLPLPDGRVLRFGVVAPRATRVRVHGQSRTTYAPTHRFPHRDTAVRYYAVPTDDESAVVEPIDGSADPVQQ